MPVKLNPNRGATPAAANAQVPAAREGAVLPLPFVSSLRGDASDVSDPDSENYNPYDPNYDESLDDSE